MKISASAPRSSFSPGKRLAAAVVFLAMTLSPGVAGAWQSNSGNTTCVSPKTVNTRVTGTDDHYHKHEYRNTTIPYDLTSHTSYRGWGFTSNVAWSVAAAGNLTSSSSNCWL